MSKCQNLKSINPEDYSGNDGGFMYEPGSSKAGGTTSYGSMTYAMFKSYMYAGLKKDDPRVQAALRWIQNHYTVKENPNMGKRGLYYYLHTFAKALVTFKQDYIVDSKGVRHNWRLDLAKTLLVEQAKDGSWVNTSDRWMEGNKVLVTSYALLCLGYVMQ